MQNGEKMKEKINQYTVVPSEQFVQEHCFGYDLCVQNFSQSWARQQKHFRDPLCDNHRWAWVSFSSPRPHWALEGQNFPDFNGRLWLDYA